MKKNDFKIGDKVKLKEPKYWSMGNAVGTVVAFDEYVRVTWEGEVRWEDYPHLSREIELAVRVGEQLVFDFMN